MSAGADELEIFEALLAKLEEGTPYPEPDAEAQRQAAIGRCRSVLARLRAPLPWDEDEEAA